jgi:predicted site-specific integrase-resolvase
MPRKRKVRNPLGPVLLVSVPTAAALLDVSPATLYRWIAEEQFRYILLPSNVMKISLQQISDITGYPVDYLVQVVRSM